MSDDTPVQYAWTKAENGMANVFGLYLGTETGEAA